MARSCEFLLFVRARAESSSFLHKLLHNLTSRGASSYERGGKFSTHRNTTFAIKAMLFRAKSRNLLFFNREPRGLRGFPLANFPRRPSLAKQKVATSRERWRLIWRGRHLAVARPQCHWTGAVDAIAFQSVTASAPATAGDASVTIAVR